MNVRLHKDVASFVKASMREGESPNLTINRLLRGEKWIRDSRPEGWSWSERMVCIEHEETIEMIDGDLRCEVPFLGIAQ